MQLNIPYSQLKNYLMLIFSVPQMKSTGEILAIDSDLNKAIYKGFLATNISKIEPIGKNGKGEKSIYINESLY